MNIQIIKNIRFLSLMLFVLFSSTVFGKFSQRVIVVNNLGRSTRIPDTVIGGDNTLKDLKESLKRYFQSLDSGFDHTLFDTSKFINQQTKMPFLEDQTIVQCAKIQDPNLRDMDIVKKPVNEIPILVLEVPDSLQIPQPAPPATATTKQSVDKKRDESIGVNVGEILPKRISLVNINVDLATDTIADVKKLLWDKEKSEFEKMKMSEADFDTLFWKLGERPVDVNKTLTSQGIMKDSTLILTGFQVFVIIPSSGTLTLEVLPSDSFDVLQQKLADRINDVNRDKRLENIQPIDIDPDYFTHFGLLLSNKNLNPNLTASQNRLYSGATLKLVNTQDQPPSAGPQYTINILAPKNERFQIQVTPEMTISQLKEQIVKVSPQLQDFNLFLDQVPLTGDDRTIDSFTQLKNNLELSLVPKARPYKPLPHQPSSPSGAGNPPPPTTGNSNLALLGAGAAAVSAAAWLAYKYKLFKLLKYGYKELSDLQITKIAQDLMNQPAFDINKVNLGRYAPEDQKRILARLKELSRK